MVACAIAIAVARPVGYEVLERTVRICGLALQLVAVGTALAGLNGVRRLFYLPPLDDTLRTWWRSAPWKRGTSGQLSGAASIGPVTTFGSLHSWAESNDSLSDAQRFAALEQRTAILLELSRNQRKQSRQDLDRLRDELASTIAEHQRSTSKTEKKLQRLALDGVATTAIGLTCAFSGIILASASPELARYLESVARGNRTPRPSQNRT